MEVQGGVEARLVTEASSPKEAAQLKALFAFRRKLLRRFLLFSALFPLIVVALSTLFFKGDATQTLPLDDDHIKDWEASEPRLVEHIRAHYHHPPAAPDVPYRLNEPERRDFSHKGQSQVVDDLLQGKRNGFFFEAGAYDGETYSNTLFFEKERGWGGLMVEPDMANVKLFLSKGRKCHLVRGCIGNSTRPQKLQFYGAMETGTAVDDMSLQRYLLTSLWRPMTKFEVWCWPLSAVMEAIGQRTIDYFVLDVEGHEMPILEANDWTSYNIDVMQIESMVFMGTHWDKTKSHERTEQIKNFVQRRLPELSYHSRVFVDLIFARTSLLKGQEP